MFPLVSLATIVPVLYLGLSGHASLAGLLVGGFFLGIGGTAFAVGVPFVSAWFPPERRGLAIGVFGAGHGRHRDQRADHGQAGEGPRHRRPVRDHRGRAGRVRRGGRAGAARRAGPGRADRAAVAAGWPRRCGCAVTWQAAALYAVAFGGYVAFSVYLPTYLKTGYGLTQADAANRMAGFVLLAVRDAAGRRLAVRPDRPGPGPDGRARRRDRRCRRAGVHPALAPLGTIAFLSMAAALGAGSGRGVRAGRACSPRRARSARSPASSAPPAASAGSCRRW